MEKSDIQQEIAKWRSVADQLERQIAKSQGELDEARRFERAWSDALQSLSTSPESTLTAASGQQAAFEDGQDTKTRPQTRDTNLRGYPLWKAMQIALRERGGQWRIAALRDELIKRGALKKKGVMGYNYVFTNAKRKSDVFDAPGEGVIRLKGAVINE